MKILTDSEIRIGKVFRCESCKELKTYPSIEIRKIDDKIVIWCDDCWLKKVLN